MAADRLAVIGALDFAPAVSSEPTICADRPIFSALDDRFGTRDAPSKPKASLTTIGASDDELLARRGPVKGHGMKRVVGYRFARLTIVSLLFGLSVSAQTGRDRTADLNAAAVVRPLFDQRSPERSPFPSDAFTVADTNQNTGRRVNLPMPSDCRTYASDCEDVAVLNQLDGFNMLARISVPFDGDIDAGSVTSKSIFLVKLRDALSGRGDDNGIVGINYIVWDPATRELSFRPDTLLDQHTRYALVVTTGVRDARRRAVGVAAEFRRSLKDLARDVDADYRRVLLAADDRVRRLLARRVDVAALSVFTTQSFSHIVERMREAVQRAPAPTLNFAVGPEGARAVFEVSRVQTLTNNAHINTQGPLTSEPLTNALVQMRAVPGAVGTLAFGSYRTLDFTTPGSGHVAPIPTRSGTLVPTRAIDVAFNLWLPSGSKPAGGWPVAIYGHGSFANKNVAFAHAAVMASHGVAVIAINALARGRGALTTMTVGLSDGTSMTFPAPGLGVDTNGDGTIDAQEPFRARRPHALLNISGPMLNAVAQQFALVRAIQSGVDADGDGARDLDGSRIYYVGQSEGSTWGIGVFAYEPAVRAAVFVVMQGPIGTTGTSQLRVGHCSRNSSHSERRR